MSDHFIGSPDLLRIPVGVNFPLDGEFDERHLDALCVANGLDRMAYFRALKAATVGLLQQIPAASLSFPGEHDAGRLAPPGLLMADAAIATVGGALIPMLGLIHGLDTPTDYAEVLNLGAQGAEASLGILSRFDWHGSRKAERCAALILAIELTCTAIMRLSEDGLRVSPLAQELGERLERLARIYADAAWDAIDTIKDEEEGKVSSTIEALALPKEINWSIHPALRLVAEVRKALEEAAKQIDR